MSVQTFPALNNTLTKTDCYDIEMIITALMQLNIIEKHYYKRRASPTIPK